MACDYLREEALAVVRTGTGKVCHTFTDFTLRGIIPLDFTRLYTSDSLQGGSLGYGWNHSLDMTLSVEPSRLVFRDRIGSERVFSSDAKASYLQDAPDSPGNAVLSRNDHGFVLLTAERRRLIFSGDIERERTLKISAIEDLNGNTVHFAYDGRNLLTAVTDTFQRQLRLFYDAFERLLRIEMFAPETQLRSNILVSFAYSDDCLVSVTDALGNSQYFEYNDHLLVKYINRLGGGSYFGYDKKRRCTCTWKDDGILFRRFDYDDLHKKVRVTNSLGVQTLYHLDDAGMVTAHIDPYGNTSQSLYTMDGDFLSSVSDSGSYPSCQFYDHQARELTYMDSLGQATTFTFNRDNQPVTITEGEASWHAAYDDRGNLRKTRNSLGAVWEYGHDSRGLLSEVKAPNGQHLKIHRSPDSRAGEMLDQQGLICSFLYGEWGQLTKVADALGNTTSLVYNAVGRLVAMTLPDGTTARYEYDAEGNLSSYTDETDRARYFRYNAFGVCIARIDALGNRAQFEYDSEMQLVGVLDANGDRLRIEYDIGGRPRREQWFDGRSCVFEYDRSGSLVAIRNETSGVRLCFSYSALGQVIAVYFGGDLQYYYEYDGFRRLVTASNADCVVRWKFDTEGRLIQEDSSDASVAYKYDLLGNQTSRRTNLGASTTHEYDLRSRLTRLLNGAGAAHTFEYDECDRMIRHRMPNGCEESLAYNSCSRIVSQTITSPRGQILSREFEYDGAGRMTKTVHTHGNSDKVYTYDRNGRLTNLDGDGISEQYGYDTANNLIYSSAAGQIRYAQGGRVLTAGETRFSFDAGGNACAKSDRSGITTYEFGPGSLQRITNPDSSAITFVHDALSRRIEKSDRDGTTRFVWADNVVCEELHSKGCGKEVRNYTFLPRTFVPLDFSIDSATYCYIVDPSGTPTEVLDGDGNVVWEAELTAWGSVRKKSVEVVTNPLRFQGQYDDGTGLYYNRYRYYDPQLGRYISPDPLGLVSGLNLYQYGPDPINTVDPLGLAALAMPALVTTSPHYNYAVVPCTPTPAAPAGCGPSNPPRNAVPNQSRGCGVPPNLRGGGGPVHNQALSDIDNANGLSTTAGNQDFRVNQQQVTAGGVRVGANRPDMQVTINGQRNYVEIDTHPATRAACHAYQICQNDGAGVVHLVTL